MYHHDARSYEVAASEAARQGRIKMEEIIHKGLAGASQVIEQVQSLLISDSVVKGSTLTFSHGSDGYRLAVPGVDPRLLHKHAIGQVCEKAGMPERFFNDLGDRGDWGAALAVQNLNTIYQHGNGTRHLVRAVGPEVRGFLSDRFRRIDSRPLVETFVETCQALGAVPIQGYALETKVRLRAALPVVFEPIPNEVMLFGVEWGNSDFGDGGHVLSLWNMRIWCTNTATLDEVLRQVHLGKRLDDNVSYSDDTYRLDTQANASALRDVIGQALAPAQINGLLEGLRKVAGEAVGIDSARSVFNKLLRKDEAVMATAAFEGPDVINLPPGNSTYRLSNAISWIAQARGVAPERQLELQRIAGNLLLPSAKLKAVEV
jgi:hypothetical protein